MLDPAVQPVEIDLQRTRCLSIRWGDGKTSVLPLTDLRRACPCASCRAEREEAAKNPLRVLKGVGSQQDMVVAEDAELVGHYALRIAWRDGHNTGIYDFRLLRSLDPGDG